MGASVLPRSSATMLAVIAAIFKSPFSIQQFKKNLKKRGHIAPFFRRLAD
jgi:hypothetical protein